MVIIMYIHLTQKPNKLRNIMDGIVGSTCIVSDDREYGPVVAVFVLHDTAWINIKNDIQGQEVKAKHI